MISPTAALAYALAAAAMFSTAATSPTLTSDPQIATLFRGLSRSTNWTLTRTVHLGFQSNHPQGLALTPDRIFLSSVEIIEPTVPYPAPKNGYDRSPGKGAGHVYVLSRNGTLEKDILLTDGANDWKYHPGGIDYDGKYVWVSVSQYRPNSRATVYSIDAETLEVKKHFNAKDHYGGIVLDKSQNRLVANNWGSRNFTAFALDGTVQEQWANPTFFIDYQDGQYIEGGLAVCSGVASVGLPANAGLPFYELGGVALVDLATHATLHEVPVSRWTKIFHSVNRNPMVMYVDAGKLTMLVAPDDGTEPGGTDLLTYVAA